MTQTDYAVQVNDEGVPKLVPHTGRKYCYFLTRKEALDLLKKLKEKNPNERYRILKRTETYNPDVWQ